ncbi:Rhodanese-like domain-containing protein [Lophiotrema nucula]|uniref:Rhodanese-like domain-containing protein n=1 Tax=Lophiotrema nucula TaxID=690887 RepID=A0A6A5ZE31_9PLEO|nr:Rhodanese-like domain-containing protein [Lophiotrema nucula]
MATQEQKQYLVDVRTPAEFSTGPLPDAINIEYQHISQLPELLASEGQDLQKNDAITLYCRSGRRSGIALQTLKSLGYDNVRDIGGLEEASAVLKREEALRGLPQVEKKAEVNEMEIKSDFKAQERKHGRAKSFSKLLDGLKELE